MNLIDIILAIVLAVTIGVGAWLAFQLLTQNGRLWARIELLEQKLLKDGQLQEHNGLPAGTILNNFALPGLDGGTVTLTDWRDRQLVLIYLNPGCPHCTSLLPALAAALPRENSSSPPAVVVSTGGMELNQRFFSQYRPACPIAIQEGAEVSSIHGATATPMAYLLGKSGEVLSAVVGGEGVLELLKGDAPAVNSNGASANGHSARVPDRSLASSRINRDGLKAGTVAPPFSLSALDGREISLDSYRGKRVLLVFSDPQCAPCNDLLPKIEQLHRGPDDLQVLMIGRGEREENLEKVRKLGLTFPVVLQKGWEISRAYGMFATPIGYLVGEDGVLLEDVAVGGKAILALPARQPAVGVQVGT